MSSKSKRARRRRRYRRAIKRNPVVAWVLNLLWPRAKVAPTNPSALRAERFQVIGFAIALLAVVIATAAIALIQSADGATPTDIDNRSE